MGRGNWRTWEWGWAPASLKPVHLQGCKCGRRWPGWPCKGEVVGGKRARRRRWLGSASQTDYIGCRNAMRRDRRRDKRRLQAGTRRGGMARAPGPFASGLEGCPSLTSSLRASSEPPEVDPPHQPPGRSPPPAQKASGAGKPPRLPVQVHPGIFATPSAAIGELHSVGGRRQGGSGASGQRTSLVRKSAGQPSRTPPKACRKLHADSGCVAAATWVGSACPVATDKPRRCWSASRRQDWHWHSAASSFSGRGSALLVCCPDDCLHRKSK